MCRNSVAPLDSKISSLSVFQSFTYVRVRATFSTGVLLTLRFRIIELSLSRTFAPGSENVLELSLPGAKMMWNFRSRERKRPGTFVPGAKKLWNFRSQ